MYVHIFKSFLPFTQPRDANHAIQRHVTSPIEIIDNYVTVPVGPNAMEVPENFPRPIVSYIVPEVTFVWRMYGGRDFDASPATKTSTKTKLGLQIKRSVSYRTILTIALFEAVVYFD